MPHNPEIVQSPDQLMRSRIESLDDEIELERSVRRHIEKRDGKWVIVFHEKSGSERLEIAEDPMVGLFTLAEAVVGNQDIDITVDAFWLGVMKDEQFREFLRRMEDNPILFLKVHALIEQVFGVQQIKQVYIPLYDELRARYEVVPQERAESVEKAPVLYDQLAVARAKRHRRISAVAGALVAILTLSVVYPAFGGESTDSAQASDVTNARVASIPPHATETIAAQTTEAPSSAQPAPPSSLESLIASTVPEESTVEIILPETTVAETAPLEVAATIPEPIEAVPSSSLAPEPSSPLATLPPNDGVKTPCDGVQVVLRPGDGGLIAILKKMYGLDDAQASKVWKSALPDEYQVRHLLASPPAGESKQFLECIPPESKVIAIATT